jgi:hypothetical protein
MLRGLHDIAPRSRTDRLLTVSVRTSDLPSELRFHGVHAHAAGQGPVARTQEIPFQLTLSVSGRRLYSSVDLIARETEYPDRISSAGG